MVVQKRVRRQVFGGAAATLVAYNPEDHPVEEKIDLDFLDLPDGVPCRVWSFWNGATWRREERLLSIEEIEPHGCVLLRITPEYSSDKQSSHSLGMDSSSHATMRRCFAGEPRCSKYVAGDIVGWGGNGTTSHS